VVREAGVQDPDVIQDLELLGGVKAQVADELADVGPVLLLDWAPSFLFPGRERVKVIFSATP
jgi:hypothetical protein